jgi:hypothetical protein
LHASLAPFSLGQLPQLLGLPTQTSDVGVEIGISGTSVAMPIFAKIGITAIFVKFGIAYMAIYWVR